VSHTHVHINGTCLTSCPSTYDSYPENDYQICKPPCYDDPALSIYQIDSSTCVAACSVGYTETTQDEIRVCIQDAPTEEDTTPGGGGTPTEEDTTPGGGGTPTEEDTTPGGGGTPTEEDTTPGGTGGGGTPTEEDTTPGGTGGGGTPTEEDTTPGGSGGGDTPTEEAENTEEDGEADFVKSSVFNAAMASKVLQPMAGISAIAVALNHPSVGYSAFVVSIIGRFLYYIKYIDVEWPPNLHYFFEVYDLRSLIPLMDPPSALRSQAEEENYTVDYCFARYGLDSSFLYNFWDWMINILLVLFIGLMLWLAEKVMRTEDQERNSCFIAVL